MRIDVIDGHGTKPMTLQNAQGALRLCPPDGVAGGDTLYLSPPWIDSHCHVFYGTNSFGLKPDDVGLKTGVHMLVDAGSVGAETFRAFAEYIVPEAKTKIRAFLNISAIGLVTMQEYYDLRHVNVEWAVETIEANRPLLAGVKVRSSGLVVEERGLEPFRRAVRAAEMANCPVMVHMGEPAPTNAENLALFRAGDILTHCFHGKDVPLWSPDGEPIPEMADALARGVLLDVGHGEASFAASTAAPIIRRGFWDFSISTDLHGRSWKIPVVNLPVTMTKFLALGMPLQAVIRSVTEIPAKRLNLDGWCNDPARNGTVFRVRAARPDDVFIDSMRRVIDARKVIEPVAVIVDGDWIAIDETVCPPQPL